MKEQKSIVELWISTSHERETPPREKRPFLILQFAVSAVWNSSTIEWLWKDPVKHHTADRGETDITLIDKVFRGRINVLALSWSNAGVSVTTLSN